MILGHDPEVTIFYGKSAPALFIMGRPLTFKKRMIQYRKDIKDQNGPSVVPLFTHFTGIRRPGSFEL